jgi:hypothetical protein
MTAAIYEDKHEGTVIEYTPESGPCQGKTLRGGRPSVDGTVVWFPVQPGTGGNKIGARVDGKPDLRAAAESYVAYHARKAEENARFVREAQEAADAFELTARGKEIRAAIDAANASEAALTPGRPEGGRTPCEISGPTDADIRSLEGNEDIEEPYAAHRLLTRAEMAETRGEPEAD